MKLYHILLVSDGYVVNFSAGENFQAKKFTEKKDLKEFEKELKLKGFKNIRRKR
jgi:hypothetical protein